MSRLGDLVRSDTAKRVMQLVIIALLVLIAWLVSGLRDKAEEEESTATAAERIAAEACGVASFVELEEQGLLAECEAAQEGNLDEAIPKDELPDPDEDPEDVDPDVIEDSPDTTIEPAPPPQGPSNEQVSAAVDDYFERNPLTASSTYQSSIRAAVSTYLTANPPAPGRPPTDREIRAAVRANLLANPPADGTDGTDGTDGVSIVSSALDGCDVVFTYSNGETSRVGPVCGPKGDPGADAPPPTADEIQAAVAAYCNANGDCAGPPGVVTVVDNCPPVGLAEQITDVNLTSPDAEGTMILSCQYGTLLGNGNGNGGGP